MTLMYSSSQVCVVHQLQCISMPNFFYYIPFGQRLYKHCAILCDQMTGVLTEQEAHLAFFKC